MPRYMLFMIPGPQATEQDWQPDAEAVGTMMKYNEELSNAGVLLALDGLLPPEKGARVTKSGGQVVTKDGPFAEAKEVVGGYWAIQAKSLDEAVEWASRCPLGEGDILEVRQIAEMEDFSDEVQQVDTSGVNPSQQPGG
jgi:hypothetical protein